MLLEFSQSASNAAVPSAKNRRSNYSISFKVFDHHVETFKTLIPEQIAEALDKDSVWIDSLQVADESGKQANVSEIMFSFTTIPEHIDFRTCRNFMAWVKFMSDNSEIGQEQRVAYQQWLLKRKQGLASSVISDGPLNEATPV